MTNSTYGHTHIYLYSEHGRRNIMYASIATHCCQVSQSFDLSTLWIRRPALSTGYHKFCYYISKLNCAEVTWAVLCWQCKLMKWMLDETAVYIGITVILRYHRKLPLLTCLNTSLMRCISEDIHRMCSQAIRAFHQDLFVSCNRPECIMSLFIPYVIYKIHNALRSINIALKWINPYQDARSACGCVC